MSVRALFATDGSEAATLACAWLQNFPLPAATDVLVATVAAVPDSLAAEVGGAVLDGAREAAETARAALARRWPGARSRVLEGDPRTALLEAADEWRADLVVLGARGLGAFAGLLLGSVSLGVTRNASCPVLVTKGVPRVVRDVVVAIDDSRDSLAAARWLATLELDPAARVRLVAVAEPPRFPSAAPGVLRPQLRTALEDIVRERTARLGRALDAAGRELAGGGVRVEHQVLVGCPGEALVGAIHAARADLALVGARGLGGFGRMLLGSVSEHVLHHAPCPVLVVKGASRREGGAGHPI